ncbi:ribose ABC transporter permease [Treponema sp.]
MPNQEALSGRGNYASGIGLTIVRNWALCFLMLMTVAFSIFGKGFFDIVNFQNMVHLATGSLLLAAAETFVIITGGIDVSIGYVYGLSSVVTAKLMQILIRSGLGLGWVLFVAIMAGLLISLIPGFVNGTLVTRFKVPSFIATMGMWGICNGVTLFFSDGFMPVMGPPDAVTKIGNGFLLYIDPGKTFSFFTKPAHILDKDIRYLIRLIPNSFFLILIVLGILGFVLKYTRFGRHTYAIGGSMDASRRAGINVDKHLIIIYTLASFVAGIAGVFDVFQTGIGNYTSSGAMYELFAVAAVVIGGASLMGGKGRIFGTSIGVILLVVLNTGLQIIGLPPFYRYIGVGILLTMAVVIDQLFPDLV